MVAEFGNISGVQAIDRKKCTFESRIATTNHPLARKLFELMSSKKTNLCVAADVTTSQELLALADKVCLNLGVCHKGWEEGMEVLLIQEFI